MSGKEAVEVGRVMKVCALSLPYGRGKENGGSLALEKSTDAALSLSLSLSMCLRFRFFVRVLHFA